jgi:hypothetical protein
LDFKGQNMNELAGVLGDYRPNDGSTIIERHEAVNERGITGLLMGSRGVFVVAPAVGVDTPAYDDRRNADNPLASGGTKYTVRTAEILPAVDLTFGASDGDEGDATFVEGQGGDRGFGSPF